MQSFGGLVSPRSCTRSRMTAWVKASPVAMGLIREFETRLARIGYDRQNAPLGELYSMAVSLRECDEGGQEHGCS